MRRVTFAIASPLSATAEVWLADTNWHRFVAEGEAIATPGEGVRLGLTLLYALGADTRVELLADVVAESDRLDRC
jgi:hypothetical protein